jgi:hypothetical protein
LRIIDWTRTLAVKIPIHALAESEPILKRLFESGLNGLLLKHLRERFAGLIDSAAVSIPPAKKYLFRYIVKFTVGGCLEVLDDWLSNGMPVPREKLLVMLDAFFALLNERFRSDLTIKVEYA